MVRRTSKHGVRQVQFFNFVGGINVSQAPEQIAENELVLCDNFLYETNGKRLVGRGGLSEPCARFDVQVRELFYDVDTNLVFVFLDNGQAFSMLNSGESVRHIGTVTGNAVPKCCKFMNKLWVASGGKLQFYDFGEASTLQLVTDSPLCDFAFVRFGRLGVTLAGDDRCSFSGIGDGAYWIENTNDASAMAWLDVGYGDSGDIVAVVPLATDLLFLKSNGMIYQLSGINSPDSWVVNCISSDADVRGVHSAINIGNSTLFISERGIKSVQATMDYGNINTSDIGDKFNYLITQSLYNPRVFNLRRQSTLLIRPSTDWSFFIAFNYALGAATVLKFAMPIHSIAESSNEVYVASGKSVYRWANEYTTDSGAPIKYKLSPKTVIGNEEILLKGIDCKLSSPVAGEAIFTDGNRLSVSVPVNSRLKVRCNHSTDSLSFSLESEKRFTVDHIALDIADL